VVTFGGTFGNFELNGSCCPSSRTICWQAIDLLGTGSRVFARRCVAGLEADVAKCEATSENSLAMCTALAPVIGYDKAAKIAKVAL